MPKPFIPPSQQAPPTKQAGPSPLPLHLALASMIWLNWPLLWQRLTPDSTGLKPSWSPPLQAKAAALAAVSAKLAPEIWTQALAAEGLRRYGTYLDGIKTYRAQPVPPPQPAPTPVQQIGSSRLLDYAPQFTSAPLLLVIPSLINRPDILDLSPQHSLLRWLVAQGIRPLLVDWGRPTATEAQHDINHYADRLQQFLLFAQQMNGGRRVQLLGHCLGGNLAVALAAIMPQACRSLILCSTPWDFHAGQPTLGRYATEMWRTLSAAQVDDGLIPAALLQSLFTLLQPMAVTQKFRQLAATPPDSQQLSQFAAVERWLNDGVALPVPVMRELVEDWYGANLPLRGGWRVNGQPIRPRRITAPTLLLMPEQDHIVPPASSAALARLLPCASVWPVPLGHIGLIVSRRAKARVWRKLADWILHHAEDI